MVYILAQKSEKRNKKPYFYILMSDKYDINTHLSDIIRYKHNFFMENVDKMSDLSYYVNTAEAKGVKT